jgi:succinoglycan biosynthesis transport protein ExoP
MDLKDFYRLIIRNLPVVAISTMVGILLAGIYSFTATPVYEADIQLFVSTPSSALDISALAQGSSFSQQRVKSYAQILNGPETLNPVIQQLHLNTTADKLAKSVKATAPLDTVLINVTVSDANAKRAADIANAIGVQFSQTANLLESASSVNQSSIKVSLVKTATVPTHPASPKKSVNLILGLLLGFGLGIGLSILRQVFDNTVKNEEQLGETPLLTAIAFDNEAKDKPLITSIGRYAARTESFRQLRTNLQFIRADNPPKVIAITSALPNEGKTTSAINLAITFAQAGMKTLLIEADLRRPRTSEYLGIEGRRAGLAELLNGQLSMDDEEELKQTLIPWGENNLIVMPTGKIPPNPAELLNSAHFRKLIAELRMIFDYIIFDCPPLLPVTDAALISTQADGTVLIVHAGATRITQFRGAFDAVSSIGGSILGVVLNMIPLSRDGEDYGYRYGYSYGYRRRYGYSNYNEYGPKKGKKRLFGGYAPLRGGYAPNQGYAPRPEDLKAEQPIDTSAVKKNDEKQI